MVLKLRLKKSLAKYLDGLLCFITFMVTGVRELPKEKLQFSASRKVYIANHNSHGDFLIIWASLPKKWRQVTKPVAGSDYWLSSPLKKFVITEVFDALLLNRSEVDKDQIIVDMSQVLAQGQSLIIFPEGTRNMSDDVILQPFKSGIYHLAKNNPDTEFIPMWIDNMKHVLPKGKHLPIPLRCQVSVGDAIVLQENESKEDFLSRASGAVLSLSPKAQQKEKTA